jgi:hypothetical protein
MQKKFLSSLVCALYSTLVPAQAQAIDSDVNDGKWAARLHTKDGQSQYARVIIENFAGTWYVLTGKDAKRSSCNGRKFPITVQASTDAGMAFTVWGSAVSPACPDVSVEVAPVDAKTLEGTTVSAGSTGGTGNTLGAGTIRLTRQ